MGRGILFTGTDTGVGKTWVMGSLAGLLRQDGHSVGVWKPVQSGYRKDDPEGDACKLKALSGVEDSLSEICQYDFAEPMAPVSASRKSGIPIQQAVLEKAWSHLSQRYETVFIEGAGGISVAFSKGFMVADLAVWLKVSVIVVAKAQLGTVNHTFLTVHYARSRGIPVLGVILNGVQKRGVHSSDTSHASLIEESAQVPVLGQIPWFEPNLKKDALFSQLKDYIHLDDWVHS